MPEIRDQRQRQRFQRDYGFQVQLRRGRKWGNGKSFCNCPSSAVNFIQLMDVDSVQDSLHATKFCDC